MNAAQKKRRLGNVPPLHNELIYGGNVPMANSKSNVSEKNYFGIPVWRRYTLTIEEAAGYYHIGEGKLRMLIDQNPHEDFYVMNGNRALIKREKFERYLDQATAV